jgi:hypothetical protein
MVKAMFGLCALLWMLSSHAHELIRVLRTEGAPVRCLESDRGRVNNRERPELEMEVNARDFVRVLSLGVKGTRWEIEEDLEFVVRFQPISCLYHEGEWIKFFETPDPSDWAEAHAPTGLFTGIVVRSNFTHLITPESFSAEDGQEYRVFFAIPSEKMFSPRQLKKLRAGGEVERLVEVTYHFSKAVSSHRPPFRRSVVEGRFPVTFTLEFVFGNGKVRLK